MGVVGVVMSRTALSFNEIESRQTKARDWLGHENGAFTVQQNVGARQLLTEPPLLLRVSCRCLCKLCKVDNRPSNEHTHTHTELYLFRLERRIYTAVTGVGRTSVS